MSCSLYSDCDGCANASAPSLRNPTGCTWCRKDEFDPGSGSCHTYGSPYTVSLLCGYSCHNLTNCTRAQPEYIGYKQISTTIVIGSLIFLFMMWGCCGCVFSCWLAMFEEGVKVAANSSAQYHEMSEIDTDGEPTPQAALTEENSSRETARARMVKKRIPYFIRCCCGCSAFWVFVLVVMLCLYYPSYPKYNICYEKDDWQSIFTTLERVLSRGEVSWNHQMLVSFYNPNRLGMSVETGVAQFFHKGMPVADWTLDEPFEMRGGSVQDMYTQMTFHPSLLEAESLLSDADFNALEFTVESDMRGTVMWGELPLFQMRSGKITQIIRIGDATDRTLCLCPAGWAF